MKQALSLAALATEVERQAGGKRDFVVDTRTLSMEPSLSLDLGEETFAVNDHAHTQLAERLGIPQKYYDRLRGEAPDLLRENVNHWFRERPKVQLVRTLFGTTRAFLSDRYQRIDHFEVLTTVLPVLQEFGASENLRVASCAVTESKLYLKAVFPKIEAEVKQGDVVQSGFVLSNSETGCGAVTVQPLIYRLVCTNGMIAKDYRQRKAHLGRSVAGEGVRELLSSETLRADDQAFLLAVRDVVRATADRDRFADIVARLSEASQRTLEQPVRALEEVKQRWGLTHPEGEAIFNHLVTGNDLSLWGLANAVTRTAQDCSSYDRATELEAVGWDIISQQATPF
jgi:hypothetical protein